MALPPGRYRVAALKPGFEVSMTEVDTLVRGALEVRLRQAARIVLGDLPSGSPNPEPSLGWILRSPLDDVFREEEARLAGAVDPEGQPSDAASPPRGVPSVEVSDAGAAGLSRWLSSPARTNASPRCTTPFFAPTSRKGSI